MWVSARIFIYIFGISFSMCAQSAIENFYKDIARKAILTNIEYYTLRLSCLRGAGSKILCGKEVAPISDKYIDNIFYVKNDFIKKYNLLYSAQILPEQYKETSLDIAKRNFFKEAVNFQRKLLIFMAIVQRDCGNPGAYQIFKNLGDWYSEYYLDDVSTMDNFLYDEYENKLINNAYKNKEQCLVFLKINSKIYSEAFGNQMELAKRSLPKDNLLSIFLDMYMIEILELSGNLSK